MVKNVFVLRDQNCVFFGAFSFCFASLLLVVCSFCVRGTGLPFYLPFLCAFYAFSDSFIALGYSRARTCILVALWSAGQNAWLSCLLSVFLCSAPSLCWTCLARQVVSDLSWFACLTGWWWWLYAIFVLFIVYSNTLQYKPRARGISTSYSLPATAAILAGFSSG